jgi:hypothetical protein
VWGSSARALELPSQVDLRASYCLVILQDAYGAAMLEQDPTTKQANLR